MPRRNPTPITGNVRTVLGGETVFRGTLKFDESLKIDGRFEGTIESPGFLLIEEGAEVVADVKVAVIVVGGTVRGDVEATDRLEMLPGGRLIGNVRSPHLIVAEGTELRGRCEMLENPAGLDIFAAPPAQLKKSLSRV